MTFPDLAADLKARLPKLRGRLMPNQPLAEPGDIVVCLGAGNITQWAYALPGELAALGAVA